MLPASVGETSSKRQGHTDKKGFNGRRQREGRKKRAFDILKGLTARAMFDRGRPFSAAAIVAPDACLLRMPPASPAATPSPAPVDNVGRNTRRCTAKPAEPGLRTEMPNRKAQSPRILPNQRAEAKIGCNALSRMTGLGCRSRPGSADTRADRGRDATVRSVRAPTRRQLTRRPCRQRSCSR